MIKFFPDYPSKQKLGFLEWRLAAQKLDSNRNAGCKATKPYPSDWAAFSPIWKAERGLLILGRRSFDTASL
ncbi:hypothetical protein [Microcoleus sp. FACHB-68]|uniref:hypothetical protein n=1 Tax=Microcoleus sp. FACHB-68 TaxID=2692826 RepID=UPI0016878A9E|nr:hypothetical protein [Microcoleus sp. FACHB-68]MBD1940696.1 hypothetical protein [Microcoleus sp. FACHB-68]